MPSQRFSYRGGPSDAVVVHYRVRNFGHGGFEREEGGIHRLVWKFFFQQMVRDATK